MADHSHRGRNRPDSKAMWDESDRRSHYSGGARDRRDNNHDRYRDDRPRGRDHRQRSRSRSPVNERRDRRDRDRDRDRERDRDRDYDRDYDRDRRRGHDGIRGKADGRHHDREREVEKERPKGRDGRRRDDGREDHTIPRGPARRGDQERSASPARSPLGKVRRAAHDPHSPLPTRSKNMGKGSGHSSVRGDAEDDDASRNSSSVKNADTRGSQGGDEERRGRRPTREEDGEVDAMDEDDDVAVEDDEMGAMQAMMGFGGFGSTKGQKVAGNNAGGVYKAKKTEYRQYMNRIGGFNRPLSPGR
ncbi:hypothetical protein F5Y14DRAFT_453560 [Nemania sp. NC0429]|nr:hypothetical protein F5Y14DRAFT_453560 [Nemania sp. NC0429]